MNNKSLYADHTIMLTTKHAKAIAIAPPFLEKLGVKVLEYVVDTDLLGTFSGEIKREGNALASARKKCEWALNDLGNKVDFALANEGSFGPHPVLPFIPADYEILYFIDRKRDFHLHVSLMTEKTNYRTQALCSFNELLNFAHDVKFPSHALILRPNISNLNELIFKGVNSLGKLEEAFKECMKFSEDKKVWIETDMRAHVNPSRMKVISEIAEKLAERLLQYCPSCNNPGWGKVREERGLQCNWCGLPTELTKSEILGCVLCNYEETKYISIRNLFADPSNCQNCNP